MEFAQWNDAQYRVMLDTVTEGLIVQDAHGRVVFANAPALRILGCSADEVVGRSETDARWESTFEDGSPVSAEAYPSAIARRTCKPVEGVVLRVFRGDGSAVWASVNARPIVDDSGAVTGVVSSFVDITELRHGRRIEASLREAEQLFERLFDRVAVGMNIVSLDGHFLRANPAYCRLVGYEPAELLSMTIFDLCDENDLDRTEKQYAQLIEGETHEYWMDKPLRRSDGTWLYARVTASIVRDDEGHPLYSVGQVTDITDTHDLTNRLAHAATHDHLTGLASRSVLDDSIAHALTSARRSGMAAVLVVDLDSFKNVNDTYGHLAGDAVLIETARRLQSLVRSTDLVVRLGGDEFVVVLTALQDREIAVDIARRIVASVAAPMAIGGNDVLVTTSVGLAIADGHERTEALLDDADRALYQAKRNGRSTFAIAQD